MSVKRPHCECCQRVRKPTLQVTKCRRCRKYVCANENCQVPHKADTCGDQFANAKARDLANAGPPMMYVELPAVSKVDKIFSGIAEVDEIMSGGIPPGRFSMVLARPDVPNEHGEVMSRDAIKRAAQGFKKC